MKHKIPRAASQHNPPENGLDPPKDNTVKCLALLPGRRNLWVLTQPGQHERRRLLVSPRGVDPLHWMAGIVSPCHMMSASPGNPVKYGDNIHDPHCPAVSFVRSQILVVM
jgi:hypothetical protein